MNFIDGFTRWSKPASLPNMQARCEGLCEAHLLQAWCAGAAAYRPRSQTGGNHHTVSCSGPRCIGPLGPLRPLRGTHFPKLLYNVLSRCARVFESASHALGYSLSSVSLWTDSSPDSIAVEFAERLTGTYRQAIKNARVAAEKNQSDKKKRSAG